ncbi:MAG: carboxypeptidase-like regulatory domain-containing protein, partial [Acidobacteriota bacterium]
MSKLTTALILLGVVILGGISVRAQATTGTLRLTVTDSNGNVVAGAGVKVKNEGTGAESTGITSGDGSVGMGALNPGAYTVTVEANGFKRAVKTGNQIQVGVTNPITVSLEAGNVSETVTVTANSEDTLQTAQSQISTTIDTRRVEDLPSNGAGGGIDTLALLVPGVIANRTGGTNTNGTGLSVNGNRGRSNNFQIDGSDNNDLSVGGPALFVDFQDSVQEFQVITNNFDARFGRNQGAIINIVGKQGTNDYHGTAFLHHQDAQALNSRDNITARDGLQNQRYLYNVFGGTVGGPVYLPNFKKNFPSVWNGKDHVFFFFAYQGIRNPQTSLGSSLSLGVLPTDFARLSSTFPGNGAIDAITKFSPWAIPGAELNQNVPGTGVAALINTNPAAGCPRAIATGTTPPIGCTGYASIVNPSTGSPFLIGGPYDVLNFGTAAAPILFQAANYQRQQDTSFTENYWNLRFDVRPGDKDNVNFRFLKQASTAKNSLQGAASGFNGDIPAGS